MGDVNEQTEEIEQIEQPVEAGAAGAPEGAVVEPEVSEIKELYEDLGIKAPVPTGKAKGRPKTSKVRTEDVPKKDAGDPEAGKQGDDNSKGESKDAPDNGKNGDSGSDPDPESKKVGKDSGEVSDESKKIDDGVHKDKSGSEKDPKPGSEGDSEPGDSGVGEPEGKSGDKKGEEDSEDEKGKRPGKSNPEVEKRFQKLTEERRAAEQRAEELERKLQEKEQAVEQSKIAQEDPEYTIDDFRTVKDREGNIIDLEPEQAELAWRRWKDGYDQRSEQRQAEANRVAAEAERESEMTRQVMEESVKAYDTLAALQDEYPELVSTSDKFDPEFAADAMPIIEEAVQYLEGTEPGNAEGNLPVIIGLKINPKKILDALKNTANKKRSLPLNGVNDNVETRSNVSVPHSRSSDPTVQAANELYKELGIKKQF